MADGSTTSNPSRRRSGLLRVGALILVVLAFAELGMRAVDAKLQRPLEWHEWEAQAKADQMQVIAEKGGVPIVALGTSAMHFAFNPVEFRSVLPGGPIAYNAALPGGLPRIMEIWSEKVVLPKLRPKLLLLGVNSTDVNDAGTQEYFYDVFADSKAVKRFTDRSSILQEIDDRIASWSSLWRFRKTIRRPMTFVNSIRGKPPLTPAAGIKTLGLDTSRQNRLVDASPEKIESFIHRRRNTWLRNYTIGGLESASLRRLVEDARARGITVVIIEMPIGDYYIRAHPRGEQDYAEFKGEIATLVRDTGSFFLDASRSVVPTPDYFADYAHLNGKGAKVFTGYVAARLREMGLA